MIRLLIFIVWMHLTNSTDFWEDRKSSSYEKMLEEKKQIPPPQNQPLKHQKNLDLKTFSLTEEKRLKETEEKLECSRLSKISKALALASEFQIKQDCLKEKLLTVEVQNLKDRISGENTPDFETEKKTEISKLRKESDSNHHWKQKRTEQIKKGVDILEAELKLTDLAMRLKQDKYFVDWFHKTKKINPKAEKDKICLKPWLKFMNNYIATQHIKKKSFDKLMKALKQIKEIRKHEKKKAKSKNSILFYRVGQKIKTEKSQIGLRLNDPKTEEDRFRTTKKVEKRKAVEVIANKLKLTRDSVLGKWKGNVNKIKTAESSKWYRVKQAVKKLAEAVVYFSPKIFLGLGLIFVIPYVFNLLKQLILDFNVIFNLSKQINLYVPPGDIPERILPMPTIPLVQSKFGDPSMWQWFRPQSKFGDPLMWEWLKLIPPPTPKLGHSAKYIIGAIVGLLFVQHKYKAIAAAVTKDAPVIPTPDQRNTITPPDDVKIASTYDILQPITARTSTNSNVSQSENKQPKSKKYAEDSKRTSGGIFKGLVWIYPVCIGVPLLLLNLGLTVWYFNKRAQKQTDPEDDEANLEFEATSEKDYSVHLHEIIELEDDCEMFENSSMESFESLKRSYESASEFGFQSDTDYGSDPTSSAFEQSLDSFQSDTDYGTDLTSPAFEQSLDSFPSDTSYGTDLTSPAFEPAFPCRDSEMNEPAEIVDLIPFQTPQAGSVLQCCASMEIDPIDQLFLNEDDLGSPLSDLDPLQESFDRHGVMHLNRSNRLTWPFKMNPRQESFDRFLEYSNGSNFDLRLVE